MGWFQLTFGILFIFLILIFWINAEFFSNFASTVPDGGIGNTPDSESVDSRFEPWSGNLKSTTYTIICRWFFYFRQTIWQTPNQELQTSSDLYWAILAGMTINSDYKNRNYSQNKINAVSSAECLYTLYTAADRLIIIEDFGPPPVLYPIRSEDMWAWVRMWIDWI